MRRSPGEERRGFFRVWFARLMRSPYTFRTSRRGFSHPLNQVVLATFDDLTHHDHLRNPVRTTKVAIGYADPLAKSGSILG